MPRACVHTAHAQQGRAPSEPPGGSPPAPQPTHAQSNHGQALMHAAVSARAALGARLASRRAAARRRHADTRTKQPRPSNHARGCAQQSTPRSVARPRGRRRAGPGGRVGVAYRPGRRAHPPLRPSVRPQASTSPAPWDRMTDLEWGFMVVPLYQTICTTSRRFAFHGRLFVPRI